VEELAKAEKQGASYFYETTNLSSVHKKFQDMLTLPKKRRTFQPRPAVEEQELERSVHNFDIAGDDFLPPMNDFVFDVDVPQMIFGDDDMNAVQEPEASIDADVTHDSKKARLSEGQEDTFQIGDYNESMDDSAVLPPLAVAPVMDEPDVEDESAANTTNMIRNFLVKDGGTLLSALTGVYLTNSDN
jgi:hypothetical protein